jgi:hypothetical protein
MTTSMSTNNKSLASKRIIMVRMTFLDSSCDFSLLNSFSVSRVAKSANSSKAVIFIPYPKQNHPKHIAIV